MKQPVKLGISAKLFLAIFATCMLLLITMHWAVRVSFERGFIDYIKHGNEQRLQLLSDALSEQYAQHGNWRFLRNNDRFIFQILRSLEHDTGRRSSRPGHAAARLAHPVLGDRPAVQPYARPLARARRCRRKAPAGR